MTLPASGTLKKTPLNEHLAERPEGPEGVDTDSHGSWMMAIRPDEGSGDAELLDAAQYTELTK